MKSILLQQNNNQNDELEMVSLVESSSSSPRLEYEESPTKTNQFTKQNELNTKKQQQRFKLLHHPRQTKWFLLLLLSILSILFIGYYIVVTYIIKRNNDTQDGYFENHYSNTNNYQIQQGEKLILSCPSNITKADNDKDEMVNEFYDHENNKNDNSNNNVTEISSSSIDVEKLKNTRYDGWNHNYNQFKDILYDWKSERFSSLQSGDRIFESGCGKGLNLLMTIEILKESKNITNLQAYGIEYVPSSTKDANHILQNLLNTDAAGNATLGSPICRGDATNLDFIPSNSFDISYTGYIDPIQDPTNLHLQLKRDVTWDDLCVSKGTPTKTGKKDQDLVEEWYSKWVKELIRITKPGKPIIVEQVSLPTCLDSNDWGGVGRMWWYRAMKKYDWNVDGDSIVIKSLYDNMKKGKRYNVFMLKKR